MISDQANVTVENKTLANISVVWVNKQSIEEVLLPVVEAGKSYVISSSTGHELRAREAVSHRLLRSFMVTAEPAQLMTIEYPSAVKEEAKAAAAPKQEESDEVKEQKRMAQESDAVGVTSTEVFAKYQPSHAQPGCAHPADVAEAASLAATPAPHCPYPLIDSMPPELISQGKLSSLQFESVALCCQRHLHVLPTPPTATAAAADSPAGGATRCGFFLGDGAGVGKGRQLAAICLDSLARGRDRHLWFSSSADLRVDAIRDLRDLGCHVAVHDGCAGLDKGSKGFGMAKELQAGVLFSTYMTLVSATSGQKQMGAVAAARAVVRRAELRGLHAL